MLGYISCHSGKRGIEKKKGKKSDNLNKALQTHIGVTVLVSPAILWTRVFVLIMADVIAIDLWQYGVIGRCYCHVAIMFATYVFVWLMLLPCCFVVS